MNFSRDLWDTIEGEIFGGDRRRLIAQIRAREVVIPARTVVIVIPGRVEYTSGPVGPGEQLTPSPGDTVLEPCMEFEP